MSDEYSNEVIDLKFSNLMEHMKGFEDFVGGKFDELITQAKYTNGKVRWAEKMIYLSIGGLGVLSLVVFPLLWALISAGRL